MVWFTIPGWDNELRFQLIGEVSMFKKQVKCINCGFLGILSIRGVQDTILTWDEISPRDRSDLSGVYKNTGLSIGCSRGQDHIIADVPPHGKPISQENLLQNAYLARRCVYYYSYNPGYTPEQHLELLRERSHRRFLIIVTLLSAAVGAAIATLVNLVWS